MPLRSKAVRFGVLLVHLLLLFIPGELEASGSAEGPAHLKLPLILDRLSGLPRSLLPFRSYGAEAGLGNLAVRRIAQDTVGFLWAGTEDGLYRYDGGRFKRFDFASGLPSTWITDLLATPEGQLWVCTPQGLAVREGNQFRVIREEAEGLPPGSCKALARDGRGVIWVAHNEGLYYRRNQQFHRVRDLPPGPTTAIASLPAPSDVVFAATKGMIFEVRNYRVETRYALESASAEPVDSLAADRSGLVWAQSARKLFCLRPGSDRLVNESSGVPAISSRGVLTVDRGGRLWIPTDEGMSCRIGDKWQHFGPKDGLPTDWTRYVFEDREGSLWISSVGIHRLVGRGSWTSWTRAQGLPSNTIWDIHRTARGDLWVATDKGLCLATGTGWRTLPGTEKSVVRRIHEDRVGRLWLALMPAAVLRYDPSSGSIKKYGGSSGIAGLRVLCLEQDGEGILWAATDGAGLLRYRPEKDDFVRSPVPEGTPEETFRYLLRDSKNRLWATGENGLLLKSGAGWRRFSRKDGLLQNHVSYITEAHSGEFWLAYFEPLGVAALSLVNEKLVIRKHLGIGDGLASEKVYMLGEDPNKHLWVGTGKGIDIVSRDGIVHFSKWDGLAGDDVNAMAFLVDQNGSVFVGTSSGLSVYRNDLTAERIRRRSPFFWMRLSATAPCFRGEINRSNSPTNSIRSRWNSPY